MRLVTNYNERWRKYLFYGLRLRQKLLESVIAGLSKPRSVPAFGLVLLDP